MEAARRGRRGRQGGGLLLVVLAALLLLLLALARGASAWAHGGLAGGAGAGAGERRYMDLAMRRMESVRSSFVARRELATSTAASSSRVYHVTDYGADPTGGADATAAINSAIADAFRRPSNATMTGGIPDLGGAEIHLDGGSYLLKGPLSLPASGGGNLKIHSGSLRAADDFPTDRYLIELSAKAAGGGGGSSPAMSYYYEYVTLRDLMLDCNYRGGGVRVVDSLRVGVDNCYVVHFATDGVAVSGGHETFVRNTFLGQHMTAGGDPGERSFTGTGDPPRRQRQLRLRRGGVLGGDRDHDVDHQLLHGLHRHRRRGPVLLHVSGSFFLGDANVVLKAVNGVARGVQIVGNLFNGRGKGVDIVELDGEFATVEQVYVAQNAATGMTVRSTTARAAAEGNGSSWTVDFSPVLLFPDRIGHVQYSLAAGDAFPGHALRNVSGNRVVIATDAAVSATVHVLVDQNSS
ncbi:hypothetical protein OsJ_16135 [Oryza sativa Japonica Group]|uniref:Pectate lyase superfamily protein domain-containing protein n=1 Tax=Oryza sativa subsp. japonica TaxID=39947 RepID=B9FCG4_ORYSJ|nr:hypothetical protein OsJ_16135 [Oryza sativa Japonica Group]